MIFRQIDEILAGKKTQTRRVVSEREFCTGMAINAQGTSCVQQYTKYHPGKRIKWQVGKQYAIVPKRGAAGIGRYFQIKRIRWESVQDISEADARAEGVSSVDEYRRLWESINTRKGVRWEDNPSVWVIEFELVGN